MVSSQMTASKQIEELLAGPLESLARFTIPGAQGSAELHLHSVKILRLLLDRAHQVLRRYFQYARQPVIA